MANHAETDKKPVYKKWWFWVIIILVISVGVSASENNNSNTVQTPSTATQTQKVEETEEEKAQRLENERIAKEQEEATFKAECKTYTFEELARNPENVKGQKVKLTGEVIQTMESSWTNSVDLRINITKGEYGYYSDTVYGTYKMSEGEDKILEDDIVTIWGTANGDYSYTSVLGSKVTLPRIDISYIEIQK